MFRYEINYWDEFDGEPKFEKGFVGAETYGSAADKIVEFYGKDNISDIKLYELENIIADNEIFETMDVEK